MLTGLQAAEQKRKILMQLLNTAAQEGNDLKVVIEANADEEEKFDVSLYIDDTTLLDKQTSVSTAAELTDNDYVVWRTKLLLLKQRESLYHQVQTAL